jgi:hypothetical protein
MLDAVAQQIDDAVAGVRRDRLPPATGEPSVGQVGDVRNQYAF